MKHLVYKTTNLVNGKYYIGVHSCNCKSCQYLGSGEALKKAIRKYGRENFKRETLREFDTRDEAFKYEKGVVQLGPQSYNLCGGGRGVGVGEKHPSYGKPSHRLGKSMSEEAKRKMSESSKGNTNGVKSLKLLAKKRRKPFTYKGVTYKSQREAAEALGVNQSTISRWFIKQNLLIP